MAPNGDKFLVLLNGRRYEGLAGNQDFRLLEFGRYALRVQPYEAKGVDVSPKAQSTPALLRERTPPALGELVWRTGLPVSALLLALLAIPLSFVNPRAGRSLNLIMAILAYMVYSNLISIAQAWVAQGRIGFAAGMWAVHLAVALLLVALFHRRLTPRPLLSLLRRR
jgi:lipopolysaccharide export system permease protein